MLAAFNTAVLTGCCGEKQGMAAMGLEGKSCFKQMSVELTQRDVGIQNTEMPTEGRNCGGEGNKESGHRDARQTWWPSPCLVLPEKGVWRINLNCYLDYIKTHYGTNEVHLWVYMAFPGRINSRVRIS